MRITLSHELCLRNKLGKLNLWRAVIGKVIRLFCKFKEGEITMFWTKRNVSTRPAILSFAVLCLTAAGLFASAQFYSTDASTNIAGNSSTAAPMPTLFAAPSATFAADAGTLGAITDHAAGCDATGGTPRNVTFTVSGVTGSVSSVEVLNLTFGSPAHSWVGDIEAVLIAPNGASHMVFGRTLATTATSCGDSTDATGPYSFGDSAAAPPNGGWWQTANILGAAVGMTPGAYRSTNIGGAGATIPMPATNMNASFAGVTNANGTWTLRLSDHGGGDTGSVSAATLSVTGATPTASDAPVDFTGDGRSDYTVVRNTGGGPSGQITWFYHPAGGGAPGAFQWGLAADFFVPEDYDGDLKDDIAVWRPGAPLNSFWYILQSNGNVVRAESFGQSGDDPTVVGDYNNDGRADLAVYRAGAGAGDPSVWYYRTTANGPVTVVGWGQNGDFPAPGDYDGDGSFDFVIQRNAGGGQAAFWRNLTSAADDIVIFGTPTDVIVPGDYDGDGKTDIATVRGSAGQILWYYEPSGTPGVQALGALWGNSTTDFPTQGDYDGDGRTDFAVWRPSLTAGQSAFWVFGSTSGSLAVPFGQNGDYPVANYNAH